MANKVSIFIENTEGKHFELSNSKMSLMMAFQYPQNNWDSILKTEVSPYDIILSDFSNSTASNFGLGYALVHKSDSREDSEKIISVCRDMLRKQYERMMEIRVAKKYDLNPIILSKLELEYHSSENYEVKINDILNESMREKREEEDN